MPATEGRVEVFVEGIPKAQPRPRAFVRRNGRAGVYDPCTAAEWRARIAVALAPRRPPQPIDAPVALELTFWLPRPRGHFGKRGLKPSAPAWPAGRPDLDNYTKALMDELSQLGWWRDDAQVVRIQATKRYASEDGRPGLFLVLEPAP